MDIKHRSNGYGKYGSDDRDPPPGWRQTEVQTEVQPKPVEPKQVTQPNEMPATPEASPPKQK